MPTMYNRPTSEAHIKTMAESVKKIGVQRAINVIVTDVFGGGMRKFYADGQHLGKAIPLIENADLFGHYAGFENHVEKIEDIIPFVSQMNSTAKNWSLKDYLNSWCTTGKKNYEFIRDLQNETKHGLNGLVEAFSNCRGFGNHTFKQGKFAPKKTIGNKTLKLYNDACGMGLHRCNSSFLAFVRICIDHQTLDSTFMLQKIEKNRPLFSAKFNREGYLQLLRNYCIEVI